MNKRVSTLAQGDEFILAGSNYVITDPPYMEGREVTIQIALINPSIDRRGILVLDNHSSFEVISHQ